MERRLIERFTISPFNCDFDGDEMDVVPEALTDIDNKLSALKVENLREARVAAKVLSDMSNKLSALEMDVKRKHAEIMNRRSELFSGYPELMEEVD